MATYLEKIKALLARAEAERNAIEDKYDPTKGQFAQGGDLEALRAYTSFINGTRADIAMLEAKDE